MDENSKWARANIPEAADLSDTELGNVSRNARKSYRVIYVVVFGIGMLVYNRFIDDQLVPVFLEQPSFWHHLVVAMIFGGLLGGGLALIIRVFVRRRIRESITSE